jgi:hypothetical protein
MNLDLYTDRAKARALEDVVHGLRVLLSDYSGTEEQIAETVVVISARFLDLIYKVLQDPNCEEHRILQFK